MRNLENIKEGDYVARMHSGWSREVSKHQVTRTTATRIYVGDTAYTRRGYRVGESSYRFSRERIEPWQDSHNELVAEGRLRQTRHELASFAWGRVDQATADAVLALIRPKESA